MIDHSNNDVTNNFSVLGHKKWIRHETYAELVQDGRGLPLIREEYEKILTLLLSKEIQPYLIDGMVPLGIDKIVVKEVGSCKVVKFSSKYTRPGYYSLYDENDALITINGFSQFQDINIYDDNYISISASFNGNRLDGVYNIQERNLINGNGDINSLEPMICSKFENKPAWIYKKKNLTYIVDSISDNVIIPKSIDGIEGFDKVYEDQYGTLICRKDSTTRLMSKSGNHHTIDHAIRLQGLAYFATDEYGGFIFKDKKTYKDLVYIPEIDLLYSQSDLEKERGRNTSGRNTNQIKYLETHLGKALIVQDPEKNNHPIMFFLKTKNYVPSIEECLCIDTSEHIILVKGDKGKSLLHGFCDGIERVHTEIIPSTILNIEQIIKYKETIKKLLQDKKNLENRFSLDENEITEQIYKINKMIASGIYSDNHITKVLKPQKNSELECLGKKQTIFHIKLKALDDQINELQSFIDTHSPKKNIEFSNDSIKKFHE